MLSCMDDVEVHLSTEFGRISTVGNTNEGEFVGSMAQAMYEPQLHIDMVQRLLEAWEVLDIKGGKRGIGSWQLERLYMHMRA